MLEKIDLTKDMGKQEAKELLNALDVELSRLQREARALNIPAMVIFEGWGAAGKGTLINRLIQPLDPRGFKVFTIQKPTEDETMHPFLWRFWTKTPAKGRIHIFDRSWYDKVLRERIDSGVHEKEKGDAYQDIVSFEETLSLDGTLIIKFFLHISKKEQKKRFEKLEESPETRWRVTKEDWKHHKQYDEYLKAYDDMLEKTDTDFAPWTIIEATDREYAAVKILTCVADRLKETIAQRSKETAADKPQVSDQTEGTAQMRTSVLSQVNLDKCYEKEEYKKRLKSLQKRLEILHSEIYKKRIPVVLAFEGWDAGGKGGAIKRLTEKMDPRGYEVIPTASPNDIEKAHHYLWRFWRAMPKDGHVAIFDRTWYGRVMVERIEGFCSTQEWKRAYKEINEMEAQLANSGAVIIKFWMQIDKDEQEKRFHERMDNPEKNWKITEEDWRNREKWDQYEVAVDEMLIRTSTACAPWIVVEGNCKYYARIKVLETFVEALEKRLKEQ